MAKRKAKTAKFEVSATKPHLSKRGIPEGAPRTVSPDDETLIELGKEMLVWLDANPKACSVEQFGIGHKAYRRREWECIIQIEAFLCYYEQAKQKIIQRMADGTFVASIGHRYLSMYDRSMYKFELEKKRQEAKSDSLGKIDALGEQGAKATLTELVKAFE